MWKFELKGQKRLFSLLASFILSGAAGTSWGAGGRPFQCDKSRCIIEDKELSIGDEVVFLNERNELVAVGVVRGIRGLKRFVDLKETHGRILADHRYELREVNATYVGQKDPAKSFIAGSLGYGSYDIGTATTGFEFSGSYLTRQFRGLDVGGQLVFSTVSGQVTKVFGPGSGDYDLSGTLLGVAGVVGYTAFKHNEVSLRGHGALGFSYLSASSEVDLQDSDVELKARPGIGLYVRGQIAAVLNRAPMHFELFAAPAFVQRATLYTFGVGLHYDLGGPAKNEARP